MMPAVQLCNVSRFQGDVPVLQGIDLLIPSGQTCAVIGPSGSGKSTLLNLIGLLDRPCAGQVWIGGTDMTGASADQRAVIRNRLIGFVFQRFHLLPRLCALDNVALPLSYRGLRLPVARQHAEVQLRAVGLASQAGKRPAGVNHVVPLQPGQHVARGVPMLALIGLDRLQVLATVEEQDLPNVQQGQPVRVTVAGQRLEGKLGPIAQQPRALDGAGAWYEVVAELELPAEPARSGLRLGMSAQVDIRISSKAQAWVIPPEALQRNGAGEPFVWFREEPGQAPSEMPVSVEGIGPQGLEVSGLGAGYIRLP